MQPDGFGYRARIGLIYIASSITMEPECYAMCPPGVSVHTTRIPLGKVNVENLMGLAGDDTAQLLEATRLLAAAPLHSIVFGCTSGSFIGGKGYDERIIARMGEVSNGIPVTTTSTAVLKALRTLGVHRVLLVTPYTRDVTDREVAFLNQNELDVVRSDCFGYDSDIDMGFITPEQVYGMVRRNDIADADCVFISCTNLRAVSILEELETELKKPVISSIQASFWDGLRLAGVSDPVPHYGQLMHY